MATPSIRDLLRVIRGQEVEEEIISPRYLISVTGEGATRLRQHREDLPLRHLIFLTRDDDIRVWLLANSHDPLDLLVLESRPEDADDLDETPTLPMGGTHFSTVTFGMNGPVLKRRHRKCRRRGRLTRMNGYRPIQEEQLGHITVLALLLRTTAT